MDPVSELIVRQNERWPVASTLLVHPPADGLVERLLSEGAGIWRVLTWEAGVLQANPAPRSSSTVGTGLSAEALVLSETLEQPVERILVCMTKARERLDLTWALLRPLWSQAREIVLCGEKRSGVESAAQRLRRAGWQADKLESARHSQWWCLVPPAHETGGGESPEAFWAEYPVEVAGRRLSLCSLPGVFSHGTVDEGSRLLLEALAATPDQPVQRCAQGAGVPQPLTRRMLDFGSGCGLLGAWLLADAQSRGRIQPWHLDALDVDALAVRSTRATLQRLPGELKEEAGQGFGFTVLHAEGCAGLRGRYDLIVTNPPFHQGQKQDLSVTRNFLQQAARLLGSRGELWLVANRFLPYADWMAAAFAQVTVVAQDNRFTVYRATQPRGGRP